MYYLDDEKIWVCGACGWGLPDKFLRKHREEEEEEERRDKSKGLITTESGTTKEEDIFVIPKVEERGYKKRIKDEYDYLRGDDTYLEKPRYNLVSEQIAIPTDSGGAQKTTTSSEDLRKQRELEQRMKERGRHVRK